jgi:hypothetical protein
MNRLCLLIVGVALTGLGCVPPFLRDEQQPPKVIVKPPPAPPVVMPDSVQENNAADRARALREELDFEEAQKKRPGAPTN